MKETKDELIKTQEQLIVFQTSLKQKYASQLKKNAAVLQKKTEAYQKEVTELVQQMLTCSKCREDSLLELTTPGRVSDNRPSSGIGSSKPISSITSLRLSATKAFSTESAMTAEDKENHRQLAFDRIDAKRYETGIPLTPVHELSSTISSESRTVTKDGTYSREHLDYTNESIDAVPQETDTIVDPADMTLDSMRESNFGPINCSTERKNSYSASQEGPMQSSIRESSQSSRLRKSVARLSIFDFEPAFTTPVRGPEGDDDYTSSEDGEDFTEDYAGETAEEDVTRDSASLDSFADVSGNGYRESLCASFVNNESFQRQIGLRSDDEDTLRESSLVIDDLVQDPNARLPSHAYGLLTDSPADSTIVDYLNEFVASQASQSISKNNNAHQETTVYEFDEEEQEDSSNKKKKGKSSQTKKTGPKKAKTKNSHKTVPKTTEAAPDTPVVKTTSKRKKTEEPKESKKTTGKKVQKVSPSSQVPSSPIVKSSKKKSSARVSTERLSVVSAEAASNSFSTARGSSVLGNSGDASALNVSQSRYPRRAKELIGYKEPPTNCKIRQGDPKWCKSAQ